MNTKITTEKWKRKVMNKKVTMIVFCFFAICLYGMTRYINHRDLMARLQKLETMESETAANLERMTDKPAFGFKTRADFDRAVIATLQRFAQRRHDERIAEAYARQAAAPQTMPDPAMHIYGNAQARTTLIEFADLECPYCKRFHDTLRRIVDASEGQVNWRWRHFPLDFHNPAAGQEAMAAECVAREKGNRGFWVFIQAVLERTRGGGGGVPDLKAAVEAAGTPWDKVSACMNRPDAGNPIAEDMAKARAYEISGTPATVILDNKTGEHHLVQGLRKAQDILAGIERMEGEEREP